MCHVIVCVYIMYAMLRCMCGYMCRVVCALCIPSCVYINVWASSDIFEIEGKLSKYINVRCCVCVCIDMYAIFLSVCVDRYAVLFVMYVVMCMY